MSDPLRNLLKSATDPLKTGPEAGRVLADKFGRAANGFGREHVLDASVSVILDIIRQTNGNKERAHAMLSEIAEKMHVLLDGHYDGATGLRKSIFAFDQMIEMRFTDDRTRGN